MKETTTITHGKMTEDQEKSSWFVASVTSGSASSPAEYWTCTNNCIKMQTQRKQKGDRLWFLHWISVWEQRTKAGVKKREYSCWVWKGMKFLMLGSSGHQTSRRRESVVWVWVVGGERESEIVREVVRLWRCKPWSLTDNIRQLLGVNFPLFYIITIITTAEHYRS